jgi:hypothetical protein
MTAPVEHRDEVSCCGGLWPGGAGMDRLLRGKDQPNRPPSFVGSGPAI